MTIPLNNKNTQVPIEFKDRTASSVRQSNEESPERQFCLNCGNHLQTNGQFCEKCGNAEFKLLWEKPK